MRNEPTTRRTALGLDVGGYATRAACWNAENRIAEELEDFRSQRQTRSALTYRNHLRLIGDEALEENPNSHQAMKTRLTTEHALQAGARWINGTEALQRYLQRLAPYWQQKTGARILKSALTIPYAFTIKERKLFLAAAQDAGVPNVMLIHEPEAAVLGYAVPERMHDDGIDEERVLVLHVGHEQTVASLLEVRLDAGLLEIDLICEETVRSGGRAMTDAAATLLANRLSLSPEQAGAPAYLREVERLLSGLGEGGSAFGYPPGAEQELTVTWETLQEATAEAVETISHGLAQLLAQAGVATTAIARALLVGEPTYHPAIRELAFPFHPEPEEREEPRFTLAYGAARYAAMLAELDTSFQFHSSMWPALGIEMADGQFDRVLYEDWQGGQRAQRLYTNATQFPNAMNFRVCQGFARVARANHMVKEIEFKDFSTRGVEGCRFVVEMEARDSELRVTIGETESRSKAEWSALK